jgi:hypothetical protein
MRDVEEQKWNMQYEQLFEFKRKKGHCMVPKRYEQDTRLGHWVGTQRRNHINGNLRVDRKKLLDELDFVWKVEGDRNIDINDKVWHQQYEKLVEFKRTNVHCRVPNRYDRDKSLGIWVSEQRKNHNNNKMRPDRKKLLDEIGFVWKADADRNTNDKLWLQQYEKLVEFKRKKGHCIVPTKYEPDRSLGHWVRNQRTSHIDNKIRLDRKELLDVIEFVWKAASTGGPSRDSTTSSIVSLPNEARVEDPERNRKRPRTCLADGGEMAARTNKRGKTTGNCSCVEDDVGGLDEEESNPTLLTSSTRIGSDPGEEVDPGEEATTLCEIPYGWARVKLEPDC